MNQYGCLAEPERLSAFCVKVAADVNPQEETLTSKSSRCERSRSSKSLFLRRASSKAAWASASSCCTSTTTGNTFHTPEELNGHSFGSSYCSTLFHLDLQGSWAGNCTCARSSSYSRYPIPSRRCRSIQPFQITHTPFRIMGAFK